MRFARRAAAPIGAEGSHVPLTSVAHQKGLARSDPPDRNEKQAQVVVDASIVGLMQAAHGTAPGGFIQLFGLGLHSGNEYKWKHRVQVNFKCIGS